MNLQSNRAVVVTDHIVLKCTSTGNSNLPASANLNLILCRLSQSTPNLYCSQHWRPQPNRRLATHLKSSKSSHTLDTRIVNIQESSKSLIGLIRQTSEELKSELASLRTLGNYNFTTVDNRTQAPSDTDTMQRLRSIRAVVNDRLKNMTVTIEQQKLTQI